MKSILKDFFKAHASLGIGYVLVDIFTVAGLAMTDLYSDEKMSIPAVLITIFLFATTLWYIIDVFILARLCLHKRIKAMGQKNENRLYRQYPNAKVDNLHHYMKDMVLFYHRHRICVVRYKDITAMEGGTKHLFLTVNGETKTLVMPFDLAGPNAVAMAFLLNKNPDIKVIRDDTVKDAD